MNGLEIGPKVSIIVSAIEKNCKTQTETIKQSNSKY